MRTTDAPKRLQLTTMNPAARRCSGRARVVGLHEDDGAFGRAFWADVPPSARLETLWDMTLEWQALQGHRGDQPRRTSSSGADHLMGTRRTPRHCAVAIAASCALWVLVVAPMGTHVRPDASAEIISGCTPISTPTNPC